MQHSPAKAWLVVMVSALYFLFTFINMNVFNALNTQLRHAFTIDNLQISNLAATYFYANVVMLIPTGLLLDRFSVRKLMLATMIVMILSVITLSQTNSYTVALASHFVTGICSTFCLLGSVVLTSRWFPPSQNGKVIGMIVTMAMIGGMLAQEIDLLEPMVGNWRHIYLLIAALGGVFWVVMYLFTQDYPKDYGIHMKEHDELQHKLGFWRCLGQACKNPQNWIAGTYTNLLNIPVVVLGGLWSINYLVSSHGLTHKEAALVSSMIFFGMIIGSPAFGWVSDRLKRRRMPMVVGAITLVVIIIVIMTMKTLSVNALIALFFLLGFFAGAQIITYAVIVEVNPHHITAASESLASVLIMSAGAIFQPLFGYLLEKSPTHSFHNAMMILPIAFVLSIVLALCTKETRCQNLFPED